MFMGENHRCDFVPIFQENHMDQGVENISKMSSSRYKDLISQNLGHFLRGWSLKGRCNIHVYDPVRVPVCVCVSLRSPPDPTHTVGLNIRIPPTPPHDPSPPYPHPYLQAIALWALTALSFFKDVVAALFKAARRPTKTHENLFWTFRKGIRAFLALAASSFFLRLPYLRNPYLRLLGLTRCVPYPWEKLPLKKCLRSGRLRKTTSNNPSKGPLQPLWRCTHAMCNAVLAAEILLLLVLCLLLFLLFVLVRLWASPAHWPYTPLDGGNSALVIGF